MTCPCLTTSITCAHFEGVQWLGPHFWGSQFHHNRRTRRHTDTDTDRAREPRRASTREQPKGRGGFRPAGRGPDAAARRMLWHAARAREWKTRGLLHAQALRLRRRRAASACFSAGLFSARRTRPEGVDATGPCDRTRPLALYPHA